MELNPALRAKRFSLLKIVQTVLIVYFLKVPDSAGTATALFSGVKTRSGVLGVDMTAKR